MPKKLNLVGQTFNQLTVISEAIKDKHGKSQWNCQCSCGNKTKVAGSALKRGVIKSCGCIKGNENILQLKNQKFNRLYVLSDPLLKPKSDGNNKSYYLCQCDCGNQIEVQGTYLKTGKTKSCGCLGSEKLIELNKERATHNQTKSKTYKVWINMKVRCYNPASESYPRYGGRGITVCNEWINSFEQFYEDMGKCPRDKSIHRVDNDGHYCPENCVWATDEEQANCRSTNRNITYLGKTQTLSQWAREYDIAVGTLWKRLAAGKSIHEALNTPVKKRIAA